MRGGKLNDVLWIIAHGSSPPARGSPWSIRRESSEPGFIPVSGRRLVSLNRYSSATYACGPVTASRNCQPNRSPDSAFEYDTSMQSWRPSGLSCVGLGQPLHPMVVTSLPTSLRRRSGRVPATPGSPISTLRCCRSPAASRLPGRGRCRLTTRSSPIRMTKTLPSCRYPLWRLTRMAAPFGRVGSVESPLTRMIRHTAGCRSRFRSHWDGSLMCPVIFSSPATVFQAFPGRGGPAPPLFDQRQLFGSP